MKALLVIDMLNDFISKKGVLFCGKSSRRIVPFIKTKINDFRKNKDLVIYVADSHDEDDREFSLFPRHCVRGTKGAKIINELKPQKQDIVVHKKTFDGVFETDLDFILKKNDIRQVYLVGVCTSICVMETVSSLVLRGYEVTVLKDGVADFDEEAHKFALKRMKVIYGVSII